MPNACDCPTAPTLSGPGFANLTKPAPGAVLYEIDWCSSVPPGGSISDDTWDVFPTETSTVLVAAPQDPSGLVTGALISGGTPGQLYKVLASVSVQGVGGPAQLATFTLWVYIPQDNTPAVFVPCEEEV